MKAKSNARTKSKSPSNNVKPDEMKKNPILPPKKGGSKKEPVKEQANPLPPKPENAQKTKEELENERKQKLKMEREKRLQREKENEKKDKEIFEKILTEAKNNNFKSQSFRSKISSNEEGMPNIKISEKKAQSILEKGGMLDAYKYLITQLCKNGLPTGNLFEYSAYVIQNYEKKWREKKSKETKEKLDKYWQEKEKSIIAKANSIDEDKKNIAVLNRSLEEIQMKRYIKELDRSRSSRRIKEPRSSSKLRSLDSNSLIDSIDKLPSEKSSVAISGKKNSNNISKVSKLPPIKKGNTSQSRGNSSGRKSEGAKSKIKK